MKTNIEIKAIGAVVAIMMAASACSKGNDDLTSPEYVSLLDVAEEGVTTIRNSDLPYILSDSLSFSENEKEMLLHMKEEEKLARDVYSALFAKWGSSVFSRISAAENNHMNSVILLLGSIGEEYTIAEEPGFFSDSAFGDLYNTLVEKGSASLGEAYTVGALIEDLDIKDLGNYLNETDNGNIILVFGNLQKGSRNHMRAFTRQLSYLGLTYTPSYISQEEYDSIISTPIESGKFYQVNGRGKHGRRNGW